MNAQDLLDEWESGEQTGMRAKRVQAVREDLMEITDEYVPRRIHEIENMILDHDQRKGVITRKLRDAVEGSDEESDADEE